MTSVVSRRRGVLRFLVAFFLMVPSGCDSDQTTSVTSERSLPELFCTVMCVSVVVQNWNRGGMRSEEHTSELQSRLHLVCRLLLEKKKKMKTIVRVRQITEEV